MYYHKIRMGMRTNRMTHTKSKYNQLVVRVRVRVWAKILAITTIEFKSMVRVQMWV
jgi:hypothetical protein